MIRYWLPDGSEEIASTDWFAGACWAADVEMWIFNVTKEIDYVE